MISQQLVNYGQFQDLNPRAETDYERARYRALWNQIISRVALRDNHLLTPDEALSHCEGSGQFDAGLKTVALGRIVGSTQRNRDFDRTFMPRQGHTRERWVNVNRAYYEGTPLPPVELYQIDDEYFVVDGHHRVSVARSHGQQFIEAHVTTFTAHCSEASNSKE